jgi:hypothetical protein
MGLVLSLTQFLARLPATLGQKAKAASLAVTIASDQDALPVTLPGGLATSSKQDTIITGLGSIDGHVDQLEGYCQSLDSHITKCNTDAVTVSSCALPTGASTAANQATCNASIASIDAKTPALLITSSATISAADGTGGGANPTAGSFVVIAAPGSKTALVSVGAGLVGTLIPRCSASMA